MKSLVCNNEKTRKRDPGFCMWQSEWPMEECLPGQDSQIVISCDRAAELDNEIKELSYLEIRHLDKQMRCVHFFLSILSGGGRGFFYNYKRAINEQ